MNACCKKSHYSVIYVTCRNVNKKNFWKTFQRDREVFDLTSNKPADNLLSVFGVAITGALGIKQLINKNLGTSRRARPLYFFNYSPQYSKVSIKSVSAGYGFTLFSGKNSKLGWKVYGCGINTDSQLGLQSRAVVKHGYPIVVEPQMIPLPQELHKITHIGCGRAHSVVVGEVASVGENAQIVYLFGNNQYGQCGRQIIEDEDYRSNCSMNTKTFPKRIKQVECGEMTTFILTEDGAVYGCGLNNHGQLGSRDWLRNISFVQIMGGGLDGKVVKQISCKSNTILALTTDGEVWAWGNNEYGTVIADMDECSVTVPRRLEMPSSAGKITQVSAGNSMCAVLDEEGQIHSWGMSFIGHGPSIYSLSQPTLINPNLFGGGLTAFNQQSSKIIDVACGVKHCVAITSSGSVYVWGWDCILKNQNQSFPVRMSLTFNAKKAFIGADHTVIMGGHIM